MGYDTSEIIEAYRRKWEETRAHRECYKPPDYKCPHCKDMGFIDLYPKKANKPAGGEIGTMMNCPYCRMDMLKNVSGIMAEYRELDIARFPWETYKTDITPIRKIIESFVYDFRKWQDAGIGLYICSQIKGSGKTMVASAICGSICSKYNIAARFTKVEDFLDDIKKIYSGKNKDEIPKVSLRRYFDTELLVLDDLGVSTISPWGKDMLHNLVNERYKARKLCIITSNYVLTELPVHPATKDRLNDMCLAVAFPEEPIRAYKAKARKDQMIKLVASYDKFMDAPGGTPFESEETHR